MSAEDQDILLKISQLAGQINRHKNQSSGSQTPFAPSIQVGNSGGMDSLIAFRKHFTDKHEEDFSQASSAWRSTRGTYSSRSHTRGGRPQVHRNRTLVLNGNDTTNLNSETPETALTNTAPTQGWVTKTDRHLQLINTAIFEKESQNRAKAMEETRKQKLKQKDEREKLRFNKHLHRLDSNSGLGGGRNTTRSTDTSNYEINVNGIQFRVAKNGSKLLKVPGEDSRAWKWLQLYIPYFNSPLPGDLNAAKATPKTALVGGVKFYRSKNGNMFRAGIIKAHRYGWSFYPGEGATHSDGADAFQTRRSGAVKKIDEPCRAFSTTGTCSKGFRCRYTHDPSKVAVCKEYLMKGSCPSGDSCDLSHELTPQRTPACLHFARGNCSNPICSYTHVRVSPAAPVCRAFGIYGYCEKGLTCEERHVHECPDFSNTGICNTKGCKLPHRLKASVMRNHTPSAKDENSDLSSDDEDEEIDSDDIDSDDLDEEFFGDDGTTDKEIPAQQDFVHFS